MLRARHTRDAAARATASQRCELQRTELNFGKTASKKRPAPEATSEDKKAAATEQLLVTNEAVTDADLDALLPDETLAKPEAPKKNATVTDADLDAILPNEGYETLTPPKKNDAEPKG